MKECMIHHTGIGTCARGVIQDEHVYLLGANDKLSPLKEFWCAREECEDGLVQFEVQSKWGFADTETGEIRIHPQWDFAGPFYSNYAHVAVGVTVDLTNSYPGLSKGGKHGYIDLNGQTIISFEYDDADDIPVKHVPDGGYNQFCVCKNEKWGFIDNQNKILLPFDFDRTNYRRYPEFIITGKGNYPDIKYGVYDKDYKEIIPTILDEQPKQISNEDKLCFCTSKVVSYFLMKKGKKFGVLCGDGRIIADITLLKRDAIALINKLSD